MAQLFAINFVLTSQPIKMWAIKAIPEEVKQDFDAILWPAVKAEYDKWTGDWAHKPTFEHETTIQREVIVFTVTVRDDENGKIFNWVDKGTGKWGVKQSNYPIPKEPLPPGKYLRFPSPYVPRTIPVNGLERDYSGTPTMYYRKSVMHPGIQPRNISSSIFNKFKEGKGAKGFYGVSVGAFAKAFVKAGLNVVKGAFGG